jgi:hypothetical protein
LVEQRGVDRVEIGQPVAGRARGQEDRLRTGHDRRPEIDLIEGVRHQGDGLRPALRRRDREQRHHEQALAAAGDGRDLGVRIERRGGGAVAPPQIAGAGLAQAGGADHRRIEVPARPVGRDRVQREGRRLMLRLADMEQDRLRIVARLDPLQQVGEALERVVVETVEACIQHGKTADMEETVPAHGARPPVKRR